MPLSKECNMCKTLKSFNNFWGDSTVKDGKKAVCIDCDKKRSKKYYCPEKTRNKNLLRNFGITAEEYDTILHEQDFKCAICDIHQKHCDKRLAVDHNHETGNIRALLCHHCNTGIGLFKENTEFLATAIKYLEKHNEL